MQIPHFGSKIKIKKKSNQFELFCTKKTLKKDHFENQPSCKGYSPCQSLILGQNLKFQKTCQNPFYKSFRVALCKKPLEKTPNNGKNETILKIGNHAKAMAHAKSSL